MNLNLKLNLLVFCLLICQPLLYCQQAIDIHGTYDVSMTYSPKNPRLSVNFEAVLAGQAWSIAATNKADTADWDMLVFDGTNTICFSPTNRVGWRSLPALKNLKFVTISRDYDQVVQSSVKIYIPWISYGLCPTNLSRNEVGLTDFAPPWMLPRHHLAAFGYKWVVESSSGGRFVDRCMVIRDSALDCQNPRDELLRPGFDCPTDLDGFQEAETDVVRRKQIPDDFTNCNYVCTKYTNIAGISIPTEAIISNFRPEPDHSAKQIQNVVLRASTFTVFDSPKSLLPIRTEPILVQDYRYRKMKNDRIFQFADYVLQPSDAWIGSEDVELKKKADDFVIYGRKFDDFGVWFKLSKKSLVRWLVAAVIIVAPFFLLWQSRNSVNRR